VINNKMNKLEMQSALEGKGYTVREFSVYTGHDEKLGEIRSQCVQVVYGEFYLPDQVQEKIDLAEDLEELGIPYIEVLDREQMKSLCGIRAAKKDFKDSMIRHARKFLSLAERVDDFQIK